tara:strand:+ start:362 stop:997 length:636 start_codon:yes stop_codon:yes gene_type:complete
MADLQSLGLQPEKGLDPAIQESVANDRLSLDRPIPGESLTNDPDNPYPFETTPEYANRTDALEYLFASFVEEGSYEKLLNLMANDIPVMTLSQVFIYKGFIEGKWNPDLMLMLAEPTAYILMALAERAGVDYKIIPDEDDDELTDEERLGEPEPEDEEYKLFGKKYTPEKLKEMERKSKISEGVLPTEISQKIKDVPVPRGLLARPEQEAV